jgi:hypothetical protein
VVQYATAVELAGYLQQDVDTYTANLVLSLASGSFSETAGTWFTAQTATFTTLGTLCRSIRLPFRPVTAISAIRINGVTVTGYTLIKNTVYRPVGFGTPYTLVPDKVEIDLTHGYTSVPDDVKAAVLETAAAGYLQANATVLSERIDDYAVTFAPGGAGVQLTPAARDVAMSYCGTWAV